MRRVPLPSWPVVIGGLILVGLMVLVFRPVPAEVETARVTRGAVIAVIAEDGRTRVRHRFVVSTPVDGEVSRIAVEPGDLVHAGRTVLATVRPAAAALLDARARGEAEQTTEAAAAAQAEARAAADRATAHADRAARDLARHRGLAAAALTTPQALEAAEAEARAAEAAVREARAAVTRTAAELARARRRLWPPARASGSPVQVTAPVDGVVLRRLRESAGLAPAGTALVELGDPRDLDVVVDLLTADAARLAAGTRARLRMSPSAPLIEGRVRLVEPGAFTVVSALGVEEQRVNAVIDVPRGPDAGSLAPGDAYRVDVEIVVDERHGVLRVPPGALFRDAGGWAVFRVEKGRARWTAVEVGVRAEDAVEIRSGVTSETLVILYPSEEISEGTKVSIRSR